MILIVLRFKYIAEGSLYILDCILDEGLEIPPFSQYRPEKHTAIKLKYEIRDGMKFFYFYDQDGIILYENYKVSCILYTLKLLLELEGLYEKSRYIYFENIKAVRDMDGIFSYLKSHI
ncbi:hypothetical protein CWI36_0039p0060 [Hamiltosporidium magnivora]|uniref:Uncharacterized protein n=1 Tax=Hamiltosporidium magnivora TaxID=148818 RepID=A0A4Q9LN10_9MICR|nr:hypothetical protein CWI36_0039p0060 [Hamiltosporidium magnivora]